MWRKTKLTINLIITALVFNFYVTTLTFLLNPFFPVTSMDFLQAFLILLSYYGPLYFILLWILFTITQFFSEHQYPIGFFSPPTLIYFLTFNTIVVSLMFLVNYEYYIDFFNSATRGNFLRILLLNLGLIILGVMFFFFRWSGRKWLQIVFMLTLSLNIYNSFHMSLSPTPPPLPSLSLNTEQSPPQLRSTPRKIRVVIMDGLSLNLIHALSNDQKLLNFNEMIRHGVSGKISCYKPNLDLALLNSAMTGLPPSQFHPHSNTKYKFAGMDHEFDLRPRFIFFRKSSNLGLISFYNKFYSQSLDNIAIHYRRLNLETIQLIRPSELPVYSNASLHRNRRFLPLFADALDKNDEKFELLKKAFFFDDFLLNQIRNYWKDDNLSYSVTLFPGLGIVSNYFYQFYDTEIGDNIPEKEQKKYGWVIEKYYEFYASIIGNLISTAKDNELLVILSFYEYEPLPVWRRILANLFDEKDVYVYKALSSQGTILLYEKNALKKDYPLKTISLFDIYPTLLYYSGFKLPKDLTGEIIREIFTDEFILHNPIEIDTTNGAYPAKNRLNMRLH